MFCEVKAEAKPEPSPLMTELQQKMEARSRRMHEGEDERGPTHDVRRGVHEPGRAGTLGSLRLWLR